MGLTPPFPCRLRVPAVLWPGKYSLGSQQHVFPGVELGGVGVLSAQVFGCCFGWELRFAHVAEIPGQVDGFTYKQDRLTSCINTCVQGNIFYSCFRHLTDMVTGLQCSPFSITTQEPSPLLALELVQRHH